MMLRHTNVTDELLSAYLDDAVTTSERALVEAAVADDPEVAWRLATLQHTVSLLGKLPDIPLPRAFALTEAMVAEPVTEAAGVPVPASIPRPRPVHEPEKIGFWQAWRSFWQGGNVLMRNAAAASFAAFLVLAVVGGTFDLSTKLQTTVSQTTVSQTAVSQTTVSQTSSLASLPEALSQDAAQAQSADAVPNLSSEADSPRRDLSAAKESVAAREGASPRAEPAALVMESAPAEPIPLPAESADEAQGAVAIADEPAAAERVVEALAPAEQPVDGVAENAEEAVRAAAAPITAAAVAMADESAPMAEMEAASPTMTDEAPPTAAPMALAAPLGDETAASSTDSAAVAPLAASADAEEIAQAGADEAIASETTASETRDLALNADAATAGDAVAADAGARPETVAASNAANDSAEAAPTTTSEFAVGEQTADAPVEKVAATAPARNVQNDAPITTSASAMSILDSDPLRFVQLLALGLTLLFAALWLLSRRANSPVQ